MKIGSELAFPSYLCHNNDLNLLTSQIKVSFQQLGIRIAQFKQTGSYLCGNNFVLFGFS